MCPFFVSFLLKHCFILECSCPPLLSVCKITHYWVQPSCHWSIRNNIFIGNQYMCVYVSFLHTDFSKLPRIFCDSPVNWNLHCPVFTAEVKTTWLVPHHILSQMTPAAVFCESPVLYSECQCRNPSLKHTNSQKVKLCQPTCRRRRGVDAAVRKIWKHYNEIQQAAKSLPDCCDHDFKFLEGYLNLTLSMPGTLKQCWLWIGHTEKIWWYSILELIRHE